MSQSQSDDIIRLVGTLSLLIVGLAAVGLIAFKIPVKDGWKASDVAMVIGSLTTFIGTVVGAFLGAQVGSAGKQKAESLAQRALAALMPEEAAKVIQEENHT